MKYTAIEVCLCFLSASFCKRANRAFSFFPLLFKSDVCCLVWILDICSLVLLPLIQLIIDVTPRCDAVFHCCMLLVMVLMWLLIYDGIACAVDCSMYSQMSGWNKHISLGLAWSFWLFSLHTVSLKFVLRICSCFSAVFLYTSSFLSSHRLIYWLRIYSTIDAPHT